MYVVVVYVVVVYVVGKERRIVVYVGELLCMSSLCMSSLCMSSENYGELLCMSENCCVCRSENCCVCRRHFECRRKIMTWLRVSELVSVKRVGE